MSRKLKFAVFVAACLALAAGPAYAAKGGGGGNGTATIAFATNGFAAAATSGTTAGSSVSFAVTANVKPADVYSLWVANVCTENGVTVSAEYHAVHDWVAGPFTTTGAECTAFVWKFPEAWTPLKGGSMTYAVG